MSQATATRVAPWKGWVRANCAAVGTESPDPRRLELGPAGFSCPDPEQARIATCIRSGGQVCLFSGYLFNRDQVAEELGGPRQPTQSVTELVLEAYRRWGDGVLAKLEGMFAVAIWDSATRRLLCGRDPVGLHPFYYAQPDGGLVFSWDAETVRSHPGVSRDLNRLALADHLCLRWLVLEETFFRDIRRLPGGHGLRFADGRLEVFRYWDPAPRGRPVQWMDPEESGQFFDVLRRSVARIMQFGRPAIFLSGGCDSPSIALCAADLAREANVPLPLGLCVDFPGALSEKAIQTIVAERLDLPYAFRYMADYTEGPGLLERGLDLEAVPLPGPPFSLYSPPYQDLLEFATTQDCQTVLTGSGGDDWLLVNDEYAADIYRTGDLMGLIRQVRYGLHGFNVVPRAYFRNLFWTSGLRPLFRDWAWRKFPNFALQRRRKLLADGIPSWLTPDPALRRELALRWERNWQRETCEDGFLLTARRASLLSPMQQCLFEEEFYRCSQAGIFTMPPYWDRPVVEFLIRVPPAILMRGGRSKALIRSALANRFPGAGYENQKKLTAVKFAESVYGREGAAVWRRLGRVRKLAELGVVQEDLFHAKLAKVQPGEGSPRHLVWRGANTENWARHYA